MTWTPADSIRPEQLWGKTDVTRFTVGRSWGLDPSAGKWRAFTDEEQARGWMSTPTGFVTVTATDREAGTFAIRGAETENKPPRVEAPLGDHHG